VLDTDTARIVLSETVDMGKTPAVEELLRREVESPRSVRNGSSLSESRAADTLIAGQFRYELMSCVHQGDSVRCTLRVTNLIEDRNFGITKNDGRIIGDDGLEYWSSGVAVGSEQGQWFVNRILPRDVPVMAFVWFGRVSQPPRRIAVLEIKVNGGMLAFRDVTLGK
jgi:hypothetical protein